MQLIKKGCLALAATIVSSLVFAGQSQAGALADYNNGTEYFRMGNIKEAMRWFDKSIAYGEKGFAEPYINKGFCLQKLGFHDRAVLCYNEAIKLNPRLAVAYQNRGTAYLHLNRYAESLKDLNKAITMPRPSSLSLVTVYIDRGRAYAGLHRWKESFADFDYVMSMQATTGNINKLKQAAADYKRQAQALMAQVGHGTTNPSAVRAKNSTPATTSSTATTSSPESTPPPTKTSTPSDTPGSSAALKTPSDASTPSTTPSTSSSGSDATTSGPSTETNSTTPSETSTQTDPNRDN